MALLLLTARRTFFPAAAALFLAGLSGQVDRTTSRSALQRHVPDHLRGRLLSIALMDRGLIPAGALLLGNPTQSARREPTS